MLSLSENAIYTFVASLGTLIRRHRVPKDGGSSGAPVETDDNMEFFTVDDFNIDIEIVLYGRCFKITDCDQFTKVCPYPVLKHFLKVRLS